MEYSIQQLAKLAGVSTRTLRYYDEIGLLSPSRVSGFGYRYYGDAEVDLLQQILFYRERKLSLDTIAQILHQPDFNLEQALEEHLGALTVEQARLSVLIQTVRQTLSYLKGESPMNDEQKFEAFKQEVVRKQEAQYGAEARQKYGAAAVEEVNQRFLSLSEADYQAYQEVERTLFRRLEEALRSGESAQSEAGKQVLLLHRKWLSYTWKSYSPQAHRGLAAMYLADERFREYYDREVPGGTEFLCAAIQQWAEVE